MNILDRFSTHLKETISAALRLASDLKNPAVEPIHLFFTLLNQKGSVGAEILNRFKINQKTLENIVLNLPVAKESLTTEKNAVATPVITPLSEPSKLVLEKAMLIAQENQHNYIGTEHLLMALLQINNQKIETALQINKIDKNEILKQLKTVLSNASQFPQLTEAMEAVERIQENLSGQLPELGGAPLSVAGAKKPRPAGHKKETALDFFAANLTDWETQKNIDPIIGRDSEVERLIQIICRRTKNNPLLLGEAGVGKTAIVEGLAKRILENKVPPILQNKKIYALDMGLLIAGTIYRGEFEGRLRQVMEEAAHNPDIIIFIDEIHNIVGAGSNQGTMDAANILKPMLARGQIRCIGATTPSEFKKHIENDPALERRFMPIVVKEPNVEDSIKILKGIKKNYELYHNVKITDAAVEATVLLSNRYLTGKFLPDKAIDLLDETAAALRVKAKGGRGDNKIARLRRRLEETALAKEDAARNDRFKEAVKLKDEEENLKKEIEKTVAAVKNKKIKILGAVTAADIAEQLAKITGVPPTEILLRRKQNVAELANKLKQRIVGQDAIIKEVSELIQRAQLCLSEANRPLASFLFVGESGVGKTELAKTIAEALYPGQDGLIKLDMSEYNESFGVSKLLGSPAGYIGYKEANQFTDKIKLNPYCVVVFDEIDKAHKDIAKLLLQILENGEIADATGKKISLKHAIIILTTSLYSELSHKSILGFGEADNKNIETEKKIIEKLKEYFSPELINRLDYIGFFNRLNVSDLAKIAALEIADLNQKLIDYKTTINYQDDILEKFIASLPKTVYNAREIRRQVRAKLEKDITQDILRDKIKKKYNLTAREKQLSLN